MALVTRLRTIRSTRRTSASARHGWSGASTTTRVSRWSASARVCVDDPVGDVDEVDLVELEHGGAGVEAADLEQVDQQRLEPVELGLQQLGRPRRRGVEGPARVVQHVAGHPHGRQRGAQLVGDVGDELLLDAAELLELADLALQVAGHLVERRRQPGQVVLTGDPHPLLEVAGRQPLGDPARHPHGRDHLPGHQPGQPRDQHEQQRGGGQQRPGDQRHASPAPRPAGTGSTACRVGRRPAAGSASRPRCRAPTARPAVADRGCRSRRCRPPRRSAAAGRPGRSRCPGRRSGSPAVSIRAPSSRPVRRAPR